MSGGGSCVGCKFLYGSGEGYSDYTWMETFVCCALDKNPNLASGEVEQPYQWPPEDGEPDVFRPTRDSRCESFKEGPYVTLCPDRCCEAGFVDFEQAEAILGSDFVPDGAEPRGWDELSHEFIRLRDKGGGTA